MLASFVFGGRKGRAVLKGRWARNPGDPTASRAGVSLAMTQARPAGQTQRWWPGPARSPAHKALHSNGAGLKTSQEVHLQVGVKARSNDRWAGPQS